VIGPFDTCLIVVSRDGTCPVDGMEVGGGGESTRDEGG